MLKRGKNGSSLLLCPHNRSIIHGVKVNLEKVSFGFPHQDPKAKDREVILKSVAVQAAGSGRALLLILVVSLVPVMNAHAGFNETLDTILAEPELTYGSAAWLVLTGSGQLSPDAGIDQAAAVMGNRNETGRVISLGEFAVLVITGWKLSGGVGWSLFKHPRYALRELRYRKFVIGRAYPNQKLSGERAVRIIGRVVDSAGGTP